MYGNVESSQGQLWVLGPSDREACGDLGPPEENPYEPLDSPLDQKPDPPPSSTWAPPARPKVGGTPRGGVTPCPPPGCCSRGGWVLGGTLVALGVSVLLNILFLTLGSRHVAALKEALEAAKEAPPNVDLADTLTPANARGEPPNVASQSFQLYNQHHDKCVEAAGLVLRAAPCRPRAPSQLFQWLRGQRLRQRGHHRCVTATSGDNLALVRLEPCREDGKLQRWECGPGDLLALAGQRLYFNYGNNQGGTVMLYTGDREWSRWRVHGTQDNVCSRSCCPPCSKGWIYFGDSCYFYSKTTSSWENAQRFCSVLGTQLLEVDTPQEKDHIRTMLESSSWLGIRDEEVEGTWKRANGTIQSRETSWWHRNEPNGGKQENCAAVREDGEWFDYPCGQELPWVCEGQP